MISRKNLWFTVLFKLTIDTTNEIKIVKKITKNKLIIVTPGIRPVNFEDSKDDQKRVMSPKEAINAGADYLVIGRPITKSNNPLKSLISINSSLE